MKSLLLALTFVIPAVAIARPVASQSAGFVWNGAVAKGKTIEIRGVNGSVRAVASDDGAFVWPQIP